MTASAPATNLSYLNYLTADNGCAIISQSSQRQKGFASNILASDPNSLWVTKEGLPQQCTISLKQMNNKPEFFNLIGFYCWHQYDSNPALIEFWVKGDIRNQANEMNKFNKADKWQLVSKIRLSLVDIWQYFKIDNLFTDKIKEVKIKIVESFGDTKIYLNKIGLFNVNLNTFLKQSHRSPNGELQKQQFISTSQPIRQKTHSQYHPHQNQQLVLSLQKQVKRTHASISQLAEEQEIMKKTILQQQKIIIKMQDTLKAVLAGMERMHNNQPQSSNKLSKWDQQQAEQFAVSKLRIKHQLYKDQEVQPYRNQKISNQKNKGSTATANRPDIQNLKSMINAFEKFESGAKQKQIQKSNKTGKRSRQQQRKSPSPPHHTDVIRTASQDDLSEYSHPNYRTSQAQNNHGSVGKGDKAKMLERLVKLLELKEMKKLELKRSGAKSRDRRSMYEEQGDEKHNYY